MRNEIWSLISYGGAPSWFITFAPADNKHPMCLYYADTKETWGSGPLLCMEGYSSLCELFFIMSKFYFDRVNPLKPNLLVLDNNDIEWEVKLSKLSKYLRSWNILKPTGHN